MTLTQWAGMSILLGLAAAGCHHKAESLTPTPVVPSAEVRQRVRHVASDALIGEVVAVMPESHLVAIGDIPVQNFRKGDILMFLGGDNTPIGAGTVVNVLPDTLHVQYEEPQVGGRSPALGDLAVYFSK